MYAITANAMRYMEEYTMSKGISGNILMEIAGRSIAEEIIQRFPNTKTEILILCGSGKNGADGLVCARWLLNNNYSNTVIVFVGERGKISKEFLEQAFILAKTVPGTDIYEIDNIGDGLYKKFDIIIDAIYGIGLNRPLINRDIDFINYINSKSAYRISVDIPSGLEASKGRVMGTAVKADLTVTFGSYKTGMFLGEGRKYSGEIKLIDIGLTNTGFKNIPDKMIVCDSDFYEKNASETLIKRSESGHKGTFGTVGIITDSKGMLGAGILAARSAYRSGCGLVKVFCTREKVQTFNETVPEAVVVPYDNNDLEEEFEGFIKGTDSILIGPGLSEDETGSLLVDKVLEENIPAVLDAGALNIISKNLRIFKRRRCQCVITPHVGEMARLCGTKKSEILDETVKYIKHFTGEYKASLVVKSDTSVVSLVTDEGNEFFLNTTGNSGLATAGSGDVLAGVIASLMAQGNSPNNSLLYGVMIHGIAADRSADTECLRRRMMAGDIVDNLFL